MLVANLSPGEKWKQAKAPGRLDSVKEPLLTKQGMNGVPARVADHDISCPNVCNVVFLLTKH